MITDQRDSDPRFPNRATMAAAAIKSAASGPSTIPTITTAPSSCA